MAYRELATGQRSRIMIGSLDGRPPAPVHESGERVFEAPNWTLDGRWLILNADGTLWRVRPEGGEPERIEVDVPPVNNDHVLDPDGEHILVSADDGHLYRTALAGGAAVRITRDQADGFRHFLHGVSPDGATLASIGLSTVPGRPVRADVYLIDVATGEQERISDGTALTDGAEFSPDGSWIYLNTEQFSTRPGHAQIARMRPDGSSLEQLTFDDRVNWFPHPSPDGAVTVFISFPPGTVGHPADQEVELKLVVGEQWAEAATVAAFFGGQGTINVNSWAPSGDRFGYVEYPVG